MRSTKPGAAPRHISRAATLPVQTMQQCGIIILQNSSCPRRCLSIESVEDQSAGNAWRDEFAYDERDSAMSKKRTKRDRSEPQARDVPSYQGVVTRKRKLLDWSFWSEHPVSIFLLFFGAIFMSPLTEFPGGNPSKIWYIAIGLWLVLGAGIFWVAQGIYRRGLPTPEEVDERYKTRIESKLEALDVRLGGTERAIAGQRPRALSAEQKKAITESMSRFRGQRIIIFNRWDDPEGSAFASGFVACLSDAGWDFSKGQFTRPQMFNADFRNVRLFISKEDYEAKTLPPAVIALATQLKQLQISDDERAWVDSDLSKGEICIRISGRMDRTQATEPLPPPAPLPNQTTTRGG